MPTPQTLLPRTPPGIGIALAVLGGVVAAILLGAQGWWVAGVGVVAGLTAFIICLDRWHALSRRIGRVGDEAAKLGRSIRPAELTPIAIDSLAEQLAQTRSDLESHIQTLSRERRDLRAIVEAVAAPVVATDADGVIRLCNAAGATLFGNPASPRGRLVEQVFTQPEILVIHAKALRGERNTRQLRIAVNDGQVRVFEVTAAPAQLSTEDEPVDRRSDDSDTTGAVLTLLDVTELATAMQLKTDFVANASHELRTPLASVRAAAETLASLEPEDHAMRTRVLGMIERNAQRLEEMVRDLLDLARLETHDAEFVLKNVDLQDVAAQLAALYEQACQDRELELRFEIPPETRLHTDPTLLTLILKNLVENALKFARPKTVVRVRMLVPLREPTLAATPSPETIRVEVIDKGPGIPLKAQQRIFERFYQVDAARTGHPQHRGTGLGLSIVKHAVRALNGKVWVESIYGEGTTMIVELPMRAPADLKADARDPEEADRPD